jgi:hypothetical protein
MPGLPRQDFARIASDLKWRVGVTVLSGPLKGNNLVFEGASLCPVGKIDSAHLLYKGADQEAVSVFSLPASVVPAGVNDASYETVAAGHPISGFVHDGGFYCVVGSGPSPLVSLDQIRGLLGQLKPQFVVPRATVALAAP